MCCFFLCHPSGALCFLHVTHFCLRMVSREEQGRKSVTGVGASIWNKPTTHRKANSIYTMHSIALNAPCITTFTATKREITVVIAGKVWRVWSSQNGDLSLNVTVKPSSCDLINSLRSLSFKVSHLFLNRPSPLWKLQPLLFCPPLCLSLSILLPRFIYLSHLWSRQRGRNKGQRVKIKRTVFHNKISPILVCEDGLP